MITIKGNRSAEIYGGKEGLTSKDKTKKERVMFHEKYGHTRAQETEDKSIPGEGTRNRGYSTTDAISIFSFVILLG